MVARYCQEFAGTISALARTRRGSIGHLVFRPLARGRVVEDSVGEDLRPTLPCSSSSTYPCVKRCFMTTVSPTQWRGAGGGILDCKFSEGGTNVVVTISETTLQPNHHHHQQQQQQDTHEAGESKIEPLHASSGASVAIPENVLQYERQLRKVQAEQRASSQLTAEKHLRIIHEDDAVLVADKPSGILCVPGLHNKPSLLELVYEHCKQPMPNPSSMIVHRLDMDTSGLVIFAKTEQALKTLQADFRDRKVFKEYHALICGHLDWLVQTSTSRIDDGCASVEEQGDVDTNLAVIQSGHIHLPLQRDHEHPPFMRVATPTSEVAATKAVENLQTHGWKKLVKKKPKPSHTEFSVLSREYLSHDTGSDDARLLDSRRLPVTRLSLVPHTGRTHQLRVHCAALGHPIVGDPTYGIYGEANPKGGLQPEDEEDACGGGASLELQKEINQRRLPNENTMCLHATKLSFQHPVTGDTLTLEAPAPF
jgi:tRNA pseudouridine32 synthase / 23S rRNA pseudouridine746 synthase